MTRRGRSDRNGGTGDMLRGRGAGAPMEVTTSGVLVVGATLPPNGIARVPLMTKDITHGGIVVVGGALGVPVQMQMVLMMGIPTHGTNGAPIATAVRGHTGTDHAPLSAHPIKRPPPRRVRVGLK